MVACAVIVLSPLAMGTEICSQQYFQCVDHMQAEETTT